ncbi:peptidylprolyl isomerase [uncultured Lacinutrix sp.]|uniref:peptidylprolyl isomerase n=1 Tax=uncultured Lacinutrix sp. TaxID=574032 RepID=UPI00261D5C13|nr:peptidylprolyl isomerase [uncultured Lacinutrix sp.]
MNKLLLVISLCFTVFISAQTSVKKELKMIETEAQAEEYLESKKSRKNKLLVFNTEKHKSKLAKELLEMPTGFTKIEKEQFKKTHYKVISKANVPHYRISYIYLDGAKLSIDKIYDLRKKIMVKYNKGVKFEDLAKRYSMADNALKGGDSGWVKDGELPIEIENEANDLKHNLDDIYDVKTEKDNGYYIIKKTHRIQEIKEVSVLKVSENID